MESIAISQHPVLHYRIPVRKAIEVLERIERSYYDRNVYHWFPDETERKRISRLLVSFWKNTRAYLEKNSWEYVLMSILKETANRLIISGHYRTQQECFWTLGYILERAPIEEGEPQAVFAQLSFVLKKRIDVYVLSN